MSPLWGYVAGVITCAMMLIFIGIWIWAWRRTIAATFDALAELPMQDEADAP